MIDVLELSFIHFPFHYFYISLFLTLSLLSLSLSLFFYFFIFLIFFIYLFFLLDGTFNVEFYLSLQICELIFSVIAIKLTLNYAMIHI